MSNASAATRPGWRLTAAVVAAGASVLVLPVTSALAFQALFPRALQVSSPSSTAVPPYAALDATACTGNGNCVAGGNYDDSLGRTQAFVAKQTQGSWSQVSKLLLPKTASANPHADVNGVACVSAGNCVAVGAFDNAAARNQAFIAMQVSGKWGRAFVVRLPANASTAVSYLNAVACTRQGFCEAVGGYTDKSGHFQTLALARPAGQRWQQGVEILPPVGAAKDPNTDMNGLTCVSARNCIATGDYAVPGAGYHAQAMGAVQANGAWRRAVRIAPPANALPNYISYIDGISCRSGTCTGVGGYYLSASVQRPMRVTESKGHFGVAKEIIAVPSDSNQSVNSKLFGISCPATGPCVAVGDYVNSSGHQTALYMTLTSGKWLAVTMLQPLDADSGTNQRSIDYSVSCVGTAHCTAVGWYYDTSNSVRAEAASTG